MFNIHAIDTRGAVDAMGCTECRYNEILHRFSLQESGEQATSAMPTTQCRRHRKLNDKKCLDPDTAALNFCFKILPTSCRRYDNDTFDYL